MRANRRPELVIVLVLLVLIAVNIAGRFENVATGTEATPTAFASPVASPVASTIEVAIDRMLYLPKRVEAPVGSTIVWTNLEGVPHTVTAPGLFSSGRMDEGGRYTRTFTEPGIYWYECLYHNNMVGLIVIE